MANGGVTGALVGASVARQRRKILAAFRAVGANAPERAVPESSLEVRGHMVFAVMKRRGIIAQTPDGRLYLNEAVEAATRRQRHLLVAAIILVAVIGIAWAYAMKTTP
jgi:hypothetical protein